MKQYFFMSIFILSSSISLLGHNESAQAYAQKLWEENPKPDVAEEINAPDGRHLMGVFGDGNGILCHETDKKRCFLVKDATRRVEKVFKISPQHFSKLEELIQSIETKENFNGESPELVELSQKKYTEIYRRFEGNDKPESADQVYFLRTEDGMEIWGHHHEGIENPELKKNVKVSSSNSSSSESKDSEGFCSIKDLTYEQVVALFKQKAEEMKAKNALQFDLRGTRFNKYILLLEKSFRNECNW